MEKPLTLKSSRKLHIVYNLPINKTSTFWKGLKEGKIYTTKCKRCNQIYFPPVADCGYCYSSNMDWIELNGEGKIVTFTQIFVKPASFSQEDSYIIGIAELYEGVKVLAWLKGLKREDVELGMKVKLVGRSISETKGIYEFIPI